MLSSPLWLFVVATVVGSWSDPWLIPPRMALDRRWLQHRWVWTGCMRAHEGSRVHRGSMRISRSTVAGIVNVLGSARGVLTWPCVPHPAESSTPIDFGPQCGFASGSAAPLGSVRYQPPCGGPPCPHVLMPPCSHGPHYTCSPAPCPYAPLITLAMQLLSHCGY